ncbi:FHA domain-containing protein [Leeia oryzae]|uniref:FHA domain-containing protein n=1 Tax=Leeia oryzae TaxID=356662 RepID=UPI00037A7156|nr:FHA domain-containing protein [Leeia oryzae]
MAEIVFVEVLDTHGKVLERHKLTDFPATIGRDYHNQIILDDPTVSLLHLSIQSNADGKVEVLDCDSENGSWSEDRRVRQTTFSDELNIRLGETEIRLRTPSARLAPTRPLDRVRLPRPILNRSWIFLLVFALCLSEASFEGYWNSFAPKALPDILLTLAPILIGLPLWAAIWGTIGRVFTGRALFFAHGTIGGLAFLSTMLVLTLKHFIAFAFNAPAFAAWLDLLLSGIGLGLLIYLHLRLASKLSMRTLGKTGVGFAALLWCGWLLSDYAQGLTANEALDIDTTLLPPKMRLTPEKSLEEFLQDAQSLAKSAHDAP